MRDIKQINNFKAAADDLWDRIIDCQYDLECIDRSRNRWLNESTQNNYANDAINRLSNEEYEIKDKQSALMHSYIIIIDKLMNLWKESAVTAMEKDV